MNEETSTAAVGKSACLGEAEPGHQAQLVSGQPQAVATMTFMPPRYSGVRPGNSSWKDPRMTKKSGLQPQRAASMGLMAAQHPLLGRPADRSAAKAS